MEAGDALSGYSTLKSDLTYAKLGQAEPAILRNQGAFHAEQAAEKAFKAVLVHAAVEFPKTHYLQTLLLLLRNSGVSVGQEIEQATGRQMRVFKDTLIIRWLDSRFARKTFAIFAILCSKNVPAMSRKRNPHRRAQRSRRPDDRRKATCIGAPAASGG